MPHPWRASLLRKHLFKRQLHEQVIKIKSLRVASCLRAVERHAEALAAQERELAQREASLQNEQDQLRQQRALLQDASSAMDKERAEARDMLKVSAPLPHCSPTPATMVYVHYFVGQS